MSEYSSKVFRQEALESYQQRGARGEVLRLSSAWTSWAYWLLVAVAGAALIFAAVFRVNRYATGPAVVLMDGRSELTARTAGTVASVLVQPGMKVKAGDALVRMDAAIESQELGKAETEFRLLLTRALRDPSDHAARQALTSAQGARQLARARLEERVVHAATAAVIGDIRVRPGQPVAAGDPLLSLVTEHTRFQLVAFLPGSYRPDLEEGQLLRFELDGRRYEYHTLSVARIADEVVGPAAARHYLPAGSADALSLSGPVVLVRASLPSPYFMSDEHSYPFFDGLQGTAEVRVRRQRILVTILPALRLLFPDERR